MVTTMKDYCRVLNSAHESNVTCVFMSLNILVRYISATSRFNAEKTGFGYLEAGFVVFSCISGM